MGRFKAQQRTEKLFKVKMAKKSLKKLFNKKKSKNSMEVDEEILQVLFICAKAIAHSHAWRTNKVVVRRKESTEDTGQLAEKQEPRRNEARLRKSDLPSLTSLPKSYYKTVIHYMKIEFYLEVRRGKKDTRILFVI